MIEAMDFMGGAGRARIVCDDCGHDEVVPCAYSNKGRGNEREGRPNVSQARARAIAMGWAYVKGKLRCGPCEAKRKVSNHKETKKVETVANVEPIRQPDRKQTRLIILALEDAYDDEAQRYKGDATDKTIAEELGGGIMPGWVTKERERLFGPAGNEELDRIRDDIAALERETRKLAETFAAEQAKKLAALSSRVDALVKSHDKRVG